MALIASQLQWLDQELASATDECDQKAQEHTAWLTETIEKNSKNLQYQMCAAAVPPPAPLHARHDPGAWAGARLSPWSDRSLRPSPRNPSLECPRSQRKPKRGRKKAMATVSVRPLAQRPPLAWTQL